jgi:plasmid stability protein
MATLVLRDLDDELVARLRARAAVNERTVEAEARESLAKDLDGFDDWMADLLAFHAEMIAKYGVFPDSTPMLREMRDE